MHLTAVVAAICLTAAVVGCGDDGAARAPDASWQSIYGDKYRNGRASAVVEIRAHGYHPRTVRIPVGGKVTWINTGTRRATAENSFYGGQSFDTHTIYRGQAKSVVFTQPGRHRYHSSYASSTFRGAVIVEPREDRSDAQS